MLKHILILAFISYASCMSIDHCCDSIESAKQCDTIDKCVNSVWKNEPTVQDGNDSCAFCVNIIKDVENFLNNQKSQEEIKTFLETACSILPEASLQTVCKDAVENDLSIIIMMIESEVTPATICAKIGLCKTTPARRLTTYTREPLAQIQKAVQEDYCGDCKKFFTDVSKIFTDKTTQAELSTMIKQDLCAQLGGLQNECDQAVDTYLPLIASLLQQEVDPAMICQAMGFCNTTRDAKTIMTALTLQKQSLPAAYCTDCKNFFADVKAILTDKATETELEALIKEQLCSQLAAMKDACDAMVDLYLPELMQMLQAEVDPSMTCQAMGFCNGTETFASIISRLEAKTKVTNLQSSAGCVLCEFVMKEVDALLTNNATEGEIIAALDKVCAILPATIRTECDDFVNQYGPAIIILLKQELTPALVCSTLGLCSSSRTRTVAAPLRASAGEDCTLCETVMQYVDSILEQNATQKDIKEVLDKVCKFLPGSIEGECEALVTMYEPMLLQILLQEATPAEVCQLLGICKDGTQKGNLKFIPQKKVGAPQTAPLLGASECTWGPGYWCQTRENAKKCNAVEHCLRHVWN